MLTSANPDSAAASIRLARSTDLPGIPGIEQAAGVRFSATDLPLALRYRVTAMQDLQAALLDERLWLAEVDPATPAGYAMADTVDGEGYLVEVDVLPRFGRQGIGALLVRAVAAWATDRHFSHLYLITFRHVPWNRPFYENLGFTAIPQRQINSGLQQLLEEEEQLGLRPESRVAMQLTL